MDSRRLLIIALVLGGLGALLWTQFGNKTPPSENEPSAQPTTAPQAAPPAAEPPPAEAVPPVPSPAPVPAPPPAGARWWGSNEPTTQTVTLGSVAPDSAFPFEVKLTTQGASVVDVRLADFFVTVDDRKLYDRDPAAYDAARAKDPETYKGRYRLLTSDSGQAALATRGLRASVTAASEGLESIGDLTDAKIRTSDWAVTEQTDTSVTFAYTVYAGGADDYQEHPMLRIEKTFRIEPNCYSLAVSYRVSNLSAASMRVSIDQAGATGLLREDVRADARGVAYGRLDSEDTTVQINLDQYKDLPELVSDGPYVIGRSDEADPVLWAGQVNKYFASLVYLRSEQGDDQLAAPSYQADFYAIKDTSDGAYLTGVVIGAKRATSAEGPTRGLILKPGASRIIALDVYTGPKDRTIFNSADSAFYRPLYKQLLYADTISAGWCFCTFSWLVFAVMWALKLFASVLFGNYGLAIILLVFIVRLVLHPLAKKSQVSMLKMQKLGPEMKKLQEKHADDKETLNREMMAFYRQQGVTPLLGCLPMFLQMPIWIALYTGINASVELRHAAFLPVWITDLAAPDALIHWSDSLPLIGDSFNLLPVLLVVAMFLQMKFTPQMAQPAAGTDGGGGQQQQQKIMRYMMPGMMLVFFYHAPSGLSLYVMSSTLAGVLDSCLVRRHIRAKEAKEAAREVTIEAPGKAARSSRPKKPKGPFWVKQG